MATSKRVESEIRKGAYCGWIYSCGALAETLGDEYRTKVCHMGIDVMGFAAKGAPMNDVECVRCSACIVNCPMDVLSFGTQPKSDPHNKLYQLQPKASLLPLILNHHPRAYFYPTLCRSPPISQDEQREHSNNGELISSTENWVRKYF